MHGKTQPDDGDDVTTGEYDTQIENVLVNTDAKTSGEIAEHCSFGAPNTRQKLSAMHEDGLVTRKRNGHSFEYELPGAADENATLDEAATMSMDTVGMTTTIGSGKYQQPVDRNYNFDAAVPGDEVAEYHSADGEYEQILAEIQTREQTGLIPHFWLTGPTGSGKTQLAVNLARDLEAPLFEVEGNYAMNEADLVGQTAYKGDETVWTDGTLVKALISSRERPTVLLLDEINRVHPKAKGSLFPALDSRCSVSIQQRGGETIHGDPNNLIVIATTNEGDIYVSGNKIDMAERGRFGSKFDVDYLGIEHPEREEELLTSRTPAGPMLAELLVDAANSVRLKAREQSSRVRVGVPTRALLGWTRAAISYDEAGLDNPVIKAFEARVLRPYYDEDPEEESVVHSIVGDSELDGCPVDEEEITEWAAGGLADVFTTTVECKGCGVKSDYDDLPAERQASMECATCGEQLIMQD